MYLKWLFDRIVAMIGLLTLWPVLLVVAMLVRLKMPGGPAFFVQKRVGKDGRLFTMYKFRSMTVGHNGSSVSVAGESRITPFGAVIRKYKLDELPELWNVLKGDMSFVGPRPDVPGYADALTGDEREVLDKVRINRYYLHHYSFWMDIKMIFATVLGRHIEYDGEII